MTPPSIHRAALPFALLMLVACNAAPSTPAEAQPTEQSEPAASGETGDAVPVIASDEPIFDFGTISPAGSVTHVFKLVNRGTADLHIERVERT